MCVCIRRAGLETTSVKIGLAKMGKNQQSINQSYATEEKFANCQLQQKKSHLN